MRRNPGPTISFYFPTSLALGLAQSVVVVPFEGDHPLLVLTGTVVPGVVLLLKKGKNHKYNCYYYNWDPYLT